MAIKIGDNFSYQGKKFLDDRQSFNTLSELQAYTNVPEGFIAYCVENKTRYEFKDGEWKEYVVASGGGGDVIIDENVATKEYVDERIENHTHENMVSKEYVDEQVSTHTHERYENKFDDVVAETDQNTGQTSLEFFSNGESKKTVYFTGGGGSGGGKPYISTELSENVLVEAGQNLELLINYYSPVTGRGTLKVFINNIDSMTTGVEQGDNTIVVESGKLSKGTNQVVVYAIDRAGTMSNSLTFYVRYGSTEFTSDFDSSVAYDYGSTIRYYFTPTALDTSMPLTFFMKIDGSVHPGVQCTSDTRSYFTFSNSLPAGRHQCECWVENSAGVKSDVERFTLVILDVNTLVVVSKTSSVSIEEGSQLSLDYRVYKKNETTFNVKIFINDSLVTSGTCGNSTTYYKTTSLLKGMYTIKVLVTDISGQYSDYVTWSVTITPSTYAMVQPTLAGAMFMGSAQNRTNGDNNRELFAGQDQDGNAVSGRLYNFSFNNESGWLDDTLLITGNSYVEIPVKPLATNAQYGMTIDVEFSARQIGAEDAEVLSLWNNEDDCGVKITSEQLILQSKTGNRCELYFSEDTVTSAIFVIDRTEKTAKIYLNGVMCAAFALSDYVVDETKYLEDFTVDDYIYLGGKNSNGYSVIKNVRVYEIALTSDEILNNFISNEKDKTTQRALVEFQKGNDLPTVTVYCDFSGLGKDDKKYCDIIYNSPDPAKYGESFALTGKHSQLQYQGTSSMQYPIKNYRLNPRDAEGKVKIKLPFCQPESRFTLKADFMSSGHWQNTGITKWINNNLYTYDENDEKSMNPAKWWAIQNGKDPNDYRECIYGFPCRLILINDGSTPLTEGQQEPTPGNTKDMGIFNFNLDKDCENSLGFTIDDFPDAMSFEVTANSDTSAGAFMSKPDLSDEEQIAYLSESFEVRYSNNEDDPMYGFLGKYVKNEDGETVFDRSYGLAALIDWVDNCTDEEFVRDFEQHFHKDYTLRYYLLVIILGMVDNLGKNMMLDSYDGKIFMPRFYDCDTVLSYDNSGAIKFDVDIEMEQGYWNTSSSRLWTRLKDLFRDELIAKYNNMRQNGLTYESFMSVLYDEQIAKIPQKYYNQDADVKYVPYGDTYLGKAHGDGYEHLKRWLKNRLIFVDTLYDYTPAYTNDMLTFRANTTDMMSITIETYTPVYQHVSWYNGNMAKAKIGRGNKVTFTGFAQAATDQEILVYGGSNVKRITGISSMNPDSMLIGNATRLVELDVSNSPILTDINSNKANLSAHTYLSKLDISNCPNLGGSLRLNFSPLIREINAMGSGITDLQLPSSIRNLQTLKVPGALETLTLNDATSLTHLEFDGFNSLKNVSMTNCNSLVNVINFDLTKVPIVSLNNSYDVEEMYMSETTDLTLTNMSKIRRLIYLPNAEYENFNLTELRNSRNYTINAVNCPNLKTFITTAPDRKSYRKDTLTHEKRPNLVFQANTLDISNTKITDIQLFCTTDVYLLKVPDTLNNFTCDSMFDIETRYVTEATFKKIHTDLIEAYTNPDVYFRYNEALELDIVPSSSDGSLIFSIHAPTVNPAVPSQGEWNLYGLKFEDFYTFGVNNDVMLSGDQITMKSRYANYDVTITNADIEPTRYPTMLYPIFINEDMPVTGSIDYKYFAGDDLSWTMAYANKDEVDISIPSSVIINADYTYNIAYESEYTYFHPNTIAVYTSRAPGLTPIFNSSFTLFNRNEVNNGNGTYTITITSKIDGMYPTKIIFENKVDLLSVEYLNTSNLNDMMRMFSGCNNLVTIDTSSWDTSKVGTMQDMFNGCTNLIYIDLTPFNTTKVQSMSYMFSGCTSLSELDLSSFDTTNVASMGYMFYGCSTLSNLNLISFNTLNTNSMDGMFQNCSSLTSLDLSSFNTSNVTNMGAMFQGCSGLTSLNISSFDTSRVENMRAMFNTCSKLASLDLSSFNTSNVTSMHGMFYYCRNLISLDLSPFNTSNVTNMGAMFQGCSGLTSLDLSSFNTSKVTNMDSMFNTCSNLTSLNVSSFNASNVTTMYDMFNGCFSLISLDVSSFNTSSATNTTNMFSSCSSLTSLKWNNWKCEANLSSSPLTEATVKGLISGLATMQTEQQLRLSSSSVRYVTDLYVITADIKNWIIPDVILPSYSRVSALDDLVYDTTPTDNICVVELTESNKYTRLDEVVTVYTGCDTIYVYDNFSVTTLSGLLRNTDEVSHNTIASDKLTSFGILPGFFNNVSSTDHMFRGCGKLSSIDSTGLNTSRVTNMSAMFYGCSGLTSLDLSSFNTSNVTNTEYMFYGCSGLTSLDLSSFNTSNVTNTEYMFNGCSGLTSLNLSSFNTSKVTNMAYMFYGCSGLTSLDLSSFNTSRVENMRAMFNTCSNLTSLDLSSFDTSRVENMRAMFNTCSKLASLDLSSFNTSNVTNTEYMFNGCSGLTSLNLSSFNTSKVTNMAYMFNTCSNLTSLDLSSFNTSNVTSMHSMFYYCRNLISLDLSPFNTSNVTSMSSMFNTCSNLTSLDLSSFNTSNVTNTEYMFNGCRNLTSLDLSSFNTSKVTDMSNMFSDCSGLTSLDLSYFDTINVTDTRAMFYGSSRLTSINFDSWDTSNINNVTSMFQGCTNLTDLDLSSFDMSNVTSFNTMFNGCAKLQFIDLSGFNTTDKLKNMGGMFWDCRVLKTVRMDGFNTENVTSIGNLFAGCRELESVDLSSFNTQNIANSAGIFDECVRLTDLKWQNWRCQVDLSETKLTSDIVKELVADLATVETTQTLTLGPTLISYLTSQEVASAISKNWNLVG